MPHQPAMLQRDACTQIRVAMSDSVTNPYLTPDTQILHFSPDAGAQPEPNLSPHLLVEVAGAALLDVGQDAARLVQYPLRRRVVRGTQGDQPVDA